MVVLGRIVAPYGVQGWVRVHAFGDEPETWSKMARWWLGPEADGEVWRDYQLKALKHHGKGLVARFDGIDDRAAAESLEGWFIAAPRDSLPKPAKDEYYWGDLVGLRVENSSGIDLGVVAELIESGANTVLVVRQGEGDAMRERLLPFVAAVVKKVDVAGGTIRVDWEADW